MRAEALQPFGDVAGLLGVILGAMAIVDAGIRQPRAQAEEGGLLGDERVGIGRVAEDEHVEAIRAGGSHRFADRLHPREYAVRLLIVGGKQQRGALLQHREGRIGAKAERPDGAGDESDDSAQHAGKGEGDPGKQDHEQGEDHPFQRRHTADRQHEIHLVGSEDGERERDAENEETPRRDRAKADGGSVGAARFAKRLHGHRQRCLGWEIDRLRWRRRREPQGVHRFIQTSDARSSPRISCTRNSMAFSPPGAS